MKKILIALLLFAAQSYAQEIPIATLENTDGDAISTEFITQIKDKPVVLAFWATWCIPCLTELSAVNDQLDSWNKKYQFDWYAISVDDDRTAKRVPTLVAGKSWTFPVLLDTNQDFKRQLNINSVPYLMVVKNGKIIYRKTGFVKGDELKVESVIAENQ